MSKEEKGQQGPQSHAEGQHGKAAHAQFINELHQGAREEPVAERLEREHQDAAFTGKRRLVEDREQHDEAEKNSERTRLAESRERGHDDEEPSDNTGSLHGVLEHREHRADYKQRGEDGVE